MTTHLSNCSGLVQVLGWRLASRPARRQVGFPLEMDSSQTGSPERSCKLAALSCLLVIETLGLPAYAHDETVYFTVQGGTSSASSKNIRDVGGSFEPGTTATNLSLDNSTLVGAKAGVYSRTGLLGIEAEVFRTRPAPKFQTQTFFEPTFGPFPQTRGASQNITATAVNVVARMPVTDRLVAHAGVGPALYRSELHFDNEQAQSSRRVGLNTQLGFTYFISKDLLVSAEWKHNAVRFDFPTHGTTEGFKTDYKANHLAIGISYAFDWAGLWKSPVNLREVMGLKPAHIGPRE